MEKIYLRIDSNGINFVCPEWHTIKETDILITPEDYSLYMELQNRGKQFKVKESPTPGEGLFGYVEQFLPLMEYDREPTETELLQEQVLQQSEYLVEMDFRLVNMELGL